MSTQNVHYIDQFSNMIHNEAQQHMSKLRPFVQMKKMTGENYWYDGLGQVDARKQLSRYAKAEFDEIEHKRRKLITERFVINLPIDATDTEKQLVDPQSRYAEAIAKGMERTFDKVVYDAMFAAVSTGQSGGTSVTFANDGGLTVNATAGWTYEKFLEIKQNFIDNDVSGPIVVGGTGDEHTDFMGEVELTSGDFSRNFFVDKGQVTKALGMDVIMFSANANTPIIDVTAGTRDCFAMAQGGICVGISRKFGVKIQDRNDLLDTKQVQITGVLGAVRTEGVLIQKVQTTD